MIGRSRGTALLPAVWLLAASLLLVTSVVRADKISDEVGDIAILDAAIEPASRGRYTDIHVRIENSGARTITLMRVETRLGERGAFDIHARPGSMMHSDSFSFGPGEQVSFGDGRFRLRLGPLGRDLMEGQVIDVIFAFDGWSTVVPIHVHKDAASNTNLLGG